MEILGTSLVSVFYRIRTAMMLGVLFLIWIILTMLYVGHFFFPFSVIEPWLMPWQTLTVIPDAETVEGRLRLMQQLLDSSTIIGNVALAGLTLSAGLFGVYLTVLYQQRARRIRENEMLTLKNIEILRRNEFIRYISATIGHEFKNNLGRIKRRISLLDVPTEARAQIDVNFDKLFADIEIFKKISDEREAGLVSFERINLKDMVRSLAGHYADLVHFEFAGGEMAPVIFASPTLLTTVFENLIDNSIKYRKPEQEYAEVEVSCSLDVDDTRRYVSLSFRDRGVGMDERAADECFYKSRSSDRGWGQGLNFVKYVVGLHAGKVRVGKEYTAAGRGAEIIIKLPFVREELGV